MEGALFGMTIKKRQIEDLREQLKFLDGERSLAWGSKHDTLTRSYLKIESELSRLRFDYVSDLRAERERLIRENHQIGMRICEINREIEEINHERQRI